MLGKEDDEDVFFGKCVVNAVFFTIAFFVIFAVLVIAAGLHPLFLIFPPIIGVFFFFVFVFYPHSLVIKKRWEIDRELLFWARHLIISLQAGLPLYDALVGSSKDYGAASEEVKKIIKLTTGGVPLVHAVRQVAENTPSNNMKRILLQIANTLTSGADLIKTLQAVTHQISTEQLTALKSYGQKLNPFIMFYLMFAIIFPSLGVAFGTILISLVSGGKFDWGGMLLVVLSVVVALLHFVFVNAIESSRPKYLV
jgi:pilus assembly protein TadC